MVEPGTILLGKYRIERVLGKGGMGVVAQAHHLQLDVPVAIKFLLPDVLVREEVVRRFLREAQAAVKLKSEHVSRILDVGTLDTGAPFMVMEYLEGNDLGALLREQRRVAVGFAVDLILQACEALAEAHALGIVHRDIKPANFFLTQGADGAPLLKILDFGVSKAPRNSDEELTHSHAVMGTPAYMSPEQMQSSKHVDSRSDIWALGVVLYQLVSGRRPFQGETFAALVMMIATQSMHPLDDVALPSGFQDVIARCLEKDPAHRFQTTAELAAALAPYAGTPMQAARSTERTVRVLGLATVPVVNVPSHARPVEDTEVPASTVRESAGEQMPLPVTLPGHLHGRLAANAAAQLTAPDRAANLEKTWRRRSTLIVMTASALLGTALAVAVAMRDNADTITDSTPTPGGVMPDASDAAARHAPSTVAQPSPSVDAGSVSNAADDAGISTQAGAKPTSDTHRATDRVRRAQRKVQRNISSTEVTNVRGQREKSEQQKHERREEDAFGTRN